VLIAEKSLVNELTLITGTDGLVVAVVDPCVVFFELLPQAASVSMSDTVIPAAPNRFVEIVTFPPWCAMDSVRNDGVLPRVAPFLQREPGTDRLSRVERL
jgi:hypothetical protein